MHFMPLRQGKSYMEKKMVRYWTSKKQKAVVSERREQLDLLFEFANAELKEKKNDTLKRQIYDLLNSTKRIVFMKDSVFAK
jgi:phage terminase large subunit-like protein